MLKATAISVAVAVTLALVLAGSWHGGKHVPTAPPELGAAASLAAQSVHDERIAASVPPKAAQKNVVARSNATAKTTASLAPKESKKPSVIPTTAKADKQRTPDAGKTPKKFPASPQLAMNDSLDGATLATKSPGVQGLYSQCLEMESFLRREQCKWQVCGGKWGQDGCPSYEKDDGEVNY